MNAFVIQTKLNYPLLLVQGFGQTCVEEFQQVQIACTPFESGGLALCDIIRQHHVIVLTETRTNELDRLMTHLHSTHKLVHATNIAQEHMGRRGYGVAIIAANACVD